MDPGTRILISGCLGHPFTSVLCVCVCGCVLTLQMQVNRVLVAAPSWRSCAHCGLQTASTAASSGGPSLAPDQLDSTLTFGPEQNSTDGTKQSETCSAIVHIQTSSMLTSLERRPNRYMQGFFLGSASMLGSNKLQTCSFLLFSLLHF